MRYLLLACVVLTGCSASPVAPATVPVVCHIPAGPITFRVLINGNVSQQPLAGLAAQLRAGNCFRDTITNADGIAEWQIPTGWYAVRVRDTDHFFREVAVSTQWLLSLPE